MPESASTRQQQTAATKLPIPVILSGTARQRPGPPTRAGFRVLGCWSDVESKDPEAVCCTMLLQGVLTKIPIRSVVPQRNSNAASPNHHRSPPAPNSTTLPATTIPSQRSQANQ